MKDDLATLKLQLNAAMVNKAQAKAIWNKSRTKANMDIWMDLCSDVNKLNRAINEAQKG